MCYYSERISLKVGILLVEVARMRCENHIKNKRTGRGYTLAKLEKLSGVSDSHISQLERGQEQPSLEVAYRLSKALECEILELEQTKHKYKYRVQGENYRNGSKNE